MKDKPPDNQILLKALEWVVNIDVLAVKASLQKYTEKNLGMDNQELAVSIFDRAKWKAVASGAMTGIATNPLLAIPSATVDVAVTLRTEVIATATVALIYDENFFDKENAKWELLIPVFAMNKDKNGSENLSEHEGMTAAALKKYIKKETLMQFQVIMAKFLAKKIAGRSVITKTVPVIGGVIGGVWNFVEVAKLKKRVLRYFSNI